MSVDYVKWNDTTFVWGGDEDFLWSEAYRVVQEVKGALGDWYVPRDWQQVKKKLAPETSDKFLQIVVKVNGLSRTYKHSKKEEIKISVEDIQKTFNHFEKHEVKVKAEIIK